MRMFIEFKRRSFGARYPNWSLRLPIDVPKEDVTPLLDSFRFGSMIWEIRPPKGVKIDFKRKKVRRGKPSRKS